MSRIKAWNHDKMMSSRGLDFPCGTQAEAELELFVTEWAVKNEKD